VACSVKRSSRAAERRRTQTDLILVETMARRTVRWILAVGTVTLAYSNGEAAAQTETSPTPPANRGHRDPPISIGPLVGFYLGGGGKIRAGTSLGLQASVGAGLVFVHYNDLSKTGSLLAQHATFYVGVPLRATAIPFVRVWRDASSKVDLSIGPAAQFDSILGWGLGAAALAEARLSEHWSLDLDWGAGYFPRAAARLIASHRVSSNADFDVPPGLQWGLDVGVSYRF
jgi:hypothetical protein